MLGLGALALMAGLVVRWQVAERQATISDRTCYARLGCAGRHRRGGMDSRHRTGGALTGVPEVTSSSFPRFESYHAALSSL